MDRSPPNRGQFDAITLSKAFVSLLFLTALVSAALSFASDGIQTLTTSVPTLYITGALAVGVLRDVTETRGWQLAFFGGLMVFTLGQYAESGDWFDLLLVVASGAMVLGLAFDAFRE